MGKSFLLLPVLLALLSGEHLGLWYVFLAISNFVATFQAGFAPSFARNVAYCWSGVKGFESKGVSTDRDQSVDYDLFKALISACEVVYRRISLITLAIVSLAGTWYVAAISGGIPLSEWAPSWLIFCIAIFMNMYFSYYESLLRGVGDFGGVNKSIIVSNILQLVSALALLLAGFELVGCAISFLIQGVSFRTLCRTAFYSSRKMKEKISNSQKPSRGEVDSIIRAIMPNSIKDTVVSFANFLMSNASTILCSLYASLSETGTFSVMLQLFNAIANISAVVLTTYQPMLQSAFSNGDIQLERKVTSKVYSGFIALYALMFLGSVIVAFPLLTVIKPTFVPDWGLIWLMGAYYFLWRLYSTSATLITNTNNIPYMWSFIFSAVAGMALSTLFMAVFDWGVAGLILGQLLVQLVYNDWKWPHEVCKRFKTSLFELIFQGCLEWESSLKSVFRR